MLQIRTVTVELLRTGPAHNQLLSPLTPYLGICDGAEAGVVQVPFEHEGFLRKLEALRDTEAEAQVRGPALRELGLEMGKLLGSVPRLPGSLGGDAAGPDLLVHLRIVISAAELALLPFELSKIPIGPTSAAEGWLSLQARVPVVVTRRTRDTSSARVRWPTQARLLFVAADPEADALPFEAHRARLVGAVSPYSRPEDLEQPARDLDGRRERYGPLLTVLRNASFDDVVHECAQGRYTHVHLLAHGGIDPGNFERRYGLVLHTRDGEPEVISGERFASAFCTLTDAGIHRPSVVTLATCDSGNAGSVLVPGASMAHALHHAGIPLVVASQYPLSMDGSVMLVGQLYPGLLRGENPLPLLHRIRTELHGRLSTHAHDWASLVVYEALPPAATFDRQLEEVRYLQAMRALRIAFEPLDGEMRAQAGRLPPERHAALTHAVERRAGDLPMDGPYRLECLGLRASSLKRLGEASYHAAMALPAEAGALRRQRIDECFTYLEDALGDYEEAALGFLRNQGGRVEQAASMHWVLTQQLGLTAALRRPVRDGLWAAARLCAEVTLDESDVDVRRAAHGTLIELWLLRLVDPELLDVRRVETTAYQRLRRQAEDQARHHAQALVKLARGRDDALVASTLRQIERYEIWAGDGFETAAQDWSRQAGAGLAPNLRPWQEIGVPGLARDLGRILDLSGAPRPWMGNEDPARPAPAIAPPVQAFLAAKPAAPARPRAAASVLRVEMLPAAHGDCLWIEYGRGGKLRRVLIDCGTDTVYRQALKPKLEALPKAQRGFELLILSHVDDDHIGGGIELLREAPALGLGFGDVWFNAWKHLAGYGFLGAVQGEKFSELIVAGGYPWNAWQRGDTIKLPAQGPLPVCKLPGGLTLTLLSPDDAKLKRMAKKWNKEVAKIGKAPGSGDFLAAEPGRNLTSTDVPRLAKSAFSSDTTEANGSSIAVLAEFEGKSVLLGADAHAPLLLASVDRLLAERGGTRLKVDAFKLPHHGSRNNLHLPLLDKLDCRHYLVSSSGSLFKHPDGEAIARVIQAGGPKPVLHFNYETKFNARWKDPAVQARWGYAAVYPAEGAQGVVLAL